MQIKSILLGYVVAISDVTDRESVVQSFESFLALCILAINIFLPLGLACSLKISIHLLYEEVSKMVATFGPKNKLNVAQRQIEYWMLNVEC